MRIYLMVLAAFCFSLTLFGSCDNSSPLSSGQKDTVYVRDTGTWIFSKSFAEVGYTIDSLLKWQIAGNVTVYSETAYAPHPDSQAGIFYGCNYSLTYIWQQPVINSSWIYQVFVDGSLIPSIFSNSTISTTADSGYSAILSDSSLILYSHGNLGDSYPTTTQLKAALDSTRLKIMLIKPTP